MRSKKILGNVPVIILIIILLIFSSITIFAWNWPPISVVESSSMEHSSQWTYGVINTGDMVIVKHVSDPLKDIKTYVIGRETNFSTYGDYGNVILYNAPGGKTIIHRAMFYLSWNGSNPVVEGYTDQSWIKVTHDFIVLYDVGFSHRNLSVYVHSYQGIDGYITMGDNNLASNVVQYVGSFNAYNASDQNAFGYQPVNVSKIVGVAYGQIPWFGLIKLNILRLYGQWNTYNEVPKNSYTYLSASLAILAIALFFPYNRLLYRKKK